MGLISPPPHHHDTYSGKDPAQPIQNLKCTQPHEEVSIKLLCVIAARVVKPTHMMVSNHVGGTLEA